MATRLDHLQAAVRHGVGDCGPPPEIDDEATRQMLAGERPTGRYLCVAGDGHGTPNLDYTVVASLAAAEEHFDRELNNEVRFWPRALVDLDDGSDQLQRIEVHAHLVPADAPWPGIAQAPTASLQRLVSELEAMPRGLSPARVELSVDGCDVVAQFMADAVPTPLPGRGADAGQALRRLVEAIDAAIARKRRRRPRRRG